MQQPVPSSSFGAPNERADRWPRVRRNIRVALTLAEILVTETVVCAVAALPSVALWLQVGPWPAEAPGLRVLVIAMLVVPSYVLFALALMLCSSTATWLTGARTVPGIELRVRDMEWPLLRWARYMVATRIVRVLAGWLFQGSPVWTAYLRLNGARIGRGVYINTLAIADHNLLEFGDGVVVGDDVHVSGHTVEGGVLKTGHVTLGRGVVVGVGAIIGIDVEAGANCQIGALSFVPKHARLDAEAVYAGIPVRRIP